MKTVLDSTEFALNFAAACHAAIGQTYDGHEYKRHLNDVVTTLLNFDFTDRDILCAAALHDVVEDTEVSVSTISDLFGEKVTKLVVAVTDAPGENRKERKAKTYPQIRAAGPKAVALKLADRIANVSHGLSTKNLRMTKMYKKEYPEFERHLRTIGELDGMWAKLQELTAQVP